MGKYIILIGIIIVIIGVVITFYDKIPFLGKLPGDISYKKDNFRFYFPLTSSIIISAVLSLILYIIKHFFRN
ncbi:MAG: DUF2905 family protein [candidate division Zixibacteria bacterium]|nr:DUF2905 family protein [candidate division Zixibacteria bacterium]